MSHFMTWKCGRAVQWIWTGYGNLRPSQMEQSYCSRKFGWWLQLWELVKCLLSLYFPTHKDNSHAGNINDSHALEESLHHAVVGLPWWTSLSFFTCLPGRWREADWIGSILKNKDIPLYATRSPSPAWLFQYREWGPITSHVAAASFSHGPLTREVVVWLKFRKWFSAAKKCAVSPEP